MAKRLQSGDIHNHIDRKKCRDSAQQLKRVLFFVAQGGGRYRKWPNGCRVATSTTTLTAENAEILPPSDPPGQLVGQSCLEGKIFSFRRAAPKRQFSNDPCGVDPKQDLREHDVGVPRCTGCRRRRAGGTVADSNPGTQAVGGGGEWRRRRQRARNPAHSL